MNHSVFDGRVARERRAMRYRFSFFVTLTFVLILGRAAQAQDTHYWMNQYGTRAQLLGGVVVGSILGLSDTYYNPGALAVAADPSLVTGAQTYQISNISIESGAGSGIDLSSTQTGFAPGMFAGLFTLDKSKRNRWAYSILTRHDFDFEVTGRKIDSRDILPATGDENFSGEVILASKLAEGWGGITWSRALNDRTGVGISQYVAVRSRRARFQTIAEAVQAGGGAGAALIIVDEFKYWNVRTLWKLGAAFDYDPVTWGFTVTTPSVNLFGLGQSYVNSALIGVDTSGDSIPDSRMAVNYQKDLKSNYKSGLSIAIGASYKFKGSVVHATVEWFNHVGPFTVLDPQDFSVQTTGQPITQLLSDERSSITNFGAGLEHRFSEHVATYASFTTDFSASATGGQTSLANWDIYHINAGSSFDIKSSELTLGLGYSFGSETVDQAVDFSNVGVIVPQQGQNEASFRRLRFIVGFELGL